MLRLFTLAASLNSSWKTHGRGGRIYELSWPASCARRCSVDARKRKPTARLGGTAAAVSYRRGPAV